MQQFYCHTCTQFVPENLLNETLHADPFGVGNMFHVERELSCPDCNGDNIEEMEPCESCGKTLPMDGLDDCAICILRDQYSHVTRYDAGDYHYAQQWLQANNPAELAAIERVKDNRRLAYFDACAARARSCD